MEPETATAGRRGTALAGGEASTLASIGTPLRAIAVATLALTWSCARVAAPATPPDVSTESPRLVEPTDVAHAALAPVRLVRAALDLGLDFVHAGGPAENGPGGPLLVLFDANNDARLDLYIPNGQPSGAQGAGPLPMGRFYSMEGERFVERTVDAGLAVPSLAGRALGARCIDFDGDGDWDLVVTFVGQERLMRNDGGRFTEVSAEAAVMLGVLDAEDRASEPDDATAGRAPAHRSAHSLARASFDANLDGHPDLLTLDGAMEPREETAEDRTREPHRPRLFLGTGAPGELIDASASSGPVFDVALAGRGLALGDLDGDSDVDVVVIEHGGHAQVWLNQNPSGHRPLRLVLLSKAPNTYALGAEVEVAAGALEEPQRARMAARYLSQHEHTLTFGLGDRGRADVTVRWPDGRTTEHRGLAPGPTHVLH